MVTVQNPINRLALKESDIPLTALYNEPVNMQKVNEKAFQKRSKPLCLNIWKDYKGKTGENLARIIKPEDEIVEVPFNEAVGSTGVVWERPPNIRDVGVLQSNKMRCTNKPEVLRAYAHENNGKPKVFTSTTISGHFPLDLNSPAPMELEQMQAVQQEEMERLQYQAHLQKHKEDIHQFSEKKRMD